MELLEGSAKAKVSLHVWQTTCCEGSSDVANYSILDLSKEGVELGSYGSHLVGRQEFGLQSKGRLVDFVFEELHAELSGCAQG